MSRIPSTRRRFLKTASAAVAAPFILPSRIWSAPVKPNDRITIGFIGYGKRAVRILPQFLKDNNAQCVAVCDVDANRSQIGKQAVEKIYSKQTDTEFKGCDAYIEHEKIMARDDIDAVVISTPDHWHTPQCMAAIKAGKDIYCEKPLTHTITEANTLIDAVKSNGTILQTGSQQRSMKGFRIACELVQNGVIGEVKRVETGFGGPPRACDLPEEKMEPGLDWSRWLGPAPMRPYNSALSPRGIPEKFPQWRAYQEYCNGQVGDWGAHHLDIAQWGLGHDGSGPVEIIPPNEPDPQSGGILRYSDGTEVNHIPEYSVVFHGSEGKIVVDRRLFQLWWGEEKKDREFISINQVLQAEEKYLNENSKRLYKSKGHAVDFLESVRSRKQPICNVEVGAGSATCCHLLNMAYSSGETVKWDPAKRALLSDHKDSIWFRKERRAPYDKLG